MDLNNVMFEFTTLTIQIMHVIIQSYALLWVFNEDVVFYRAKSSMLYDVRTAGFPI
jgi:hypothetical protein